MRRLDNEKVLTPEVKVLNTRPGPDARSPPPDSGGRGPALEIRR